MAKVLDLDVYRTKRKELIEEAKRLANSKDNLTDAERLAYKEARLLELQSEVMDALLNDIAMLVGKHIELQNQFVIVSAQAYLALQILQEVGIISPEKLQEKWTELMAKTIRGDGQEVDVQGPEEETPRTPHPLVEKLGGYEPTEEDIGRILSGEDPKNVLPSDMFE